MSLARLAAARLKITDESETKPFSGGSIELISMLDVLERVSAGDDSRFMSLFT